MLYFIPSRIKPRYIDRSYSMLYERLACRGAVAKDLRPR